MLKGKKVVLRPLSIEADLQKCLEWVNDYEVVQFLGVPFKPITKEKERAWFEKIIHDETSVCFAIETHDGKFIGTTGIGRINHHDGTAVTGSLIGDKNYWGRGYGTDAKMLLLWYAFTVLNLRRINSRVIAFNTRSLRCQLTCGYKIEGAMKREIYKNGRYHDLIMLAVFRKGWMRLWRRYLKSVEKS